MDQQTRVKDGKQTSYLLISYWRFQCQDIFEIPKQTYCNCSSWFNNTHGSPNKFVLEQRYKEKKK
jgi:hypothetical protein